LVVGGGGGGGTTMEFHVIHSKPPCVTPSMSVSSAEGKCSAGSSFGHLERVTPAGAHIWAPTEYLSPLPAAYVHHHGRDHNWHDQLAMVHVVGHDSARPHGHVSSMQARQSAETHPFRALLGMHTQDRLHASLAGLFYERKGCRRCA